jgi:hypothetical protein
MGFNCRWKEERIIYKCADNRTLRYLHRLSHTRCQDRVNNGDRHFEMRTPNPRPYLFLLVSLCAVRVPSDDMRKEQEQDQFDNILHTSFSLIEYS